jgi:transposase
MPAVKRLGRPRETELRAVWDAILYIARTGCQWRMLAKDFPPFTTVQGYFDDWRDDGLFERINFELLPSRSSNAPLTLPALYCCRAAGSSNDRAHSYNVSHGAISQNLI